MPTPSRFFRWLAAADTVREADPFVRRHYARNFAINMGDAGLYLFGMSFASATVVLPLFLSHFTHSQLLLGLVTGLIEAGVSLPQLFVVPLVNQRQRQLPFLRLSTLAPRSLFLGMAVLMFFSLRWPPTAVAWGLLGLVALFGLTTGITVGLWQELIAKTIPAERRGRFFGLRLTFGGALGIAGAAVASWVLEAFPFPFNFALCLLITFISLMGSYFFFVRTQEPATPPRANNAAPWRAGLALLRRDANFARFVSAYWLITLGGMATGFYAVYAVGHFALTALQAGWLNTVWFTASTLSNVVWGWANDRHGPKAVLVGGAIAQVAALSVALAAPSAGWLYVAFALASMGVAAILVGGLTLPMIIGPEAERPLYIGLTNTLRAPASVGASIVGGWLAQAWGYPTMFGCAIGLGVVGVLVLVVGVRRR